MNLFVCATRGDCELEFQPLELKVAYQEPCHLKSQKHAHSPKDMLNVWRQTNSVHLN